MGRPIGRYTGRSHEKSRALYAAIRERPGTKKQELYRKLGWSWGSFCSVLASMDNHDLLLTENDEGGLFIFDSI